MDTTIQMRSAIPARIDRLPLSREIWSIMLLAGVAWLVESYDVGGLPAYRDHRRRLHSRQIRGRLCR